jgi:hypothetical protein
MLALFMSSRWIIEHFLQAFKVDFLYIKHGWLNSWLVSHDNPCRALQAWWHKLHQNIIKGIAISIVVWHYYYYVEQWSPLGFKCIVPQVLQIKRLVLWMWYWVYYDNYLKWPKLVFLPNMATFWMFTIWKIFGFEKSIYSN